MSLLFKAKEGTLSWTSRAPGPGLAGCVTWRISPALWSCFPTGAWGGVQAPSAPASAVSFVTLEAEETTASGPEDVVCWVAVILGLAAAGTAGSVVSCCLSRRRVVPCAAGSMVISRAEKTLRIGSSWPRPGWQCQRQAGPATVGSLAGQLAGQPLLLPLQPPGRWQVPTGHQSSVG